MIQRYHLNVNLFFHLIIWFIIYSTVVIQSLSKSQLQEVIFSNRYKLDNESLPSGLDELALLNKTAEEYGFEVDQEKANKILKSEKNIPSLKEKYDGAVLQIRGEYSIEPEFSMRTEEGFIKGELFIFHETITNKNHKMIAEKLFKERAVKLFPGCDEEYLYQAISEVTETYLHETLKKIARDLPIIHVSFDSDGRFTVKVMGNV